MPQDLYLTCRLWNDCPVSRPDSCSPSSVNKPTPCFSLTVPTGDINILELTKNSVHAEQHSRAAVTIGAAKKNLNVICTQTSSHIIHLWFSKNFAQPCATLISTKAVGPCLDCMSHKLSVEHSSSVFHFQSLTYIRLSIYLIFSTPCFY